MLWEEDVVVMFATGTQASRGRPNWAGITTVAMVVVVVVVAQAWGINWFVINHYKSVGPETGWSIRELHVQIYDLQP